MVKDPIIPQEYFKIFSIIIVNDTYVNNYFFTMYAIFNTSNQPMHT